MESVRQITTALLAGEGADEMLQAIAGRASELVDADGAAIVIAEPSDEARLMVRAAHGHAADRLRGAVFPGEGTPSGSVIAEGRPAVLTDVSAHPRVSQPMRLGEFGPGLFVPISGTLGPLGTLVVANRHGGRTFHDAELKVVGSLAVQAGLAIEYRRAQGRTPPVGPGR